MKVLIVGGTSGLGAALAGVFHSEGWQVAVTGLREESIKAWQARWPDIPVRRLDLADIPGSRRVFSEMAGAMGGLDAVVVSAGHFEADRGADWGIEEKAIALNALGCAGVLNAAFQHLLSRGGGRLAALSSIGEVRGNGACPAYNASKAFLSNYLEGLRQTAHLSGSALSVTVIVPAYIPEQGRPRAARRMFRAIVSRERRAYVPSYWRLLAAVYRNLPDILHEKLSRWHYLLLRPFTKLRP